MAGLASTGITLASKNVLSNSVNEHQDSALIDDDLGQSMTHPGYWTENSVLTLSLDSENFQSGNKKIRYIVWVQFCQHVLLITSLGISAIVVVIAITIPNVISQDSVSSTAWKSIILLRYIGLYSFSGGVATFLSKELVFQILTKCCWRRQYKKIKIVNQFLRKFLINVIFNAKFLRKYLKRAKNILDCDQSQATVSFTETPKFDDWINNRCDLMLQSPEGIILNNLGITIESLKGYLNTILLESITEFHKQVLVNHSGPQFSATTFQKQIENILLERLSMDGDQQLNSFISDLFRLYMDELVAIACVISAVIGALVGVVTLFS